MPNFSITGMIAQKAADLDLNKGIPGKIAGRMLNIFTVPAACADIVANLAMAAFKAPFSPFVSAFNGIQWLRKKQMCTSFSVSDVLKNIIKAVEHVFYIVLGPVVGLISPQTLYNRFFKVSPKAPTPPSSPAEPSKEAKSEPQQEEAVADSIPLTEVVVEHILPEVAAPVIIPKINLQEVKAPSETESESDTDSDISGLVPPEPVEVQSKKIEEGHPWLTEAFAKQKAELEAKAEANRLEDLAQEAKRQGELAKQAEARLKAEQEAQAEAKRQAEIAKEAEARRKAEQEAQAEAKRQADLVQEAERKAAEAIQQQLAAKQAEMNNKIQAISTEKDKTFLAIEKERKAEIKKLEKSQKSKIDEAYANKEMRLDQSKDEVEKGELIRAFEIRRDGIKQKIALKIEEINRDAKDKKDEVSLKADASIRQITREYVVK